MSKIIAIDFDGVLVENQYPDIGMENPMIVEAAKEYRRLGCKLILWTCRKGKYLQDALNWCKDHGIEFDAVNENLPEILEAFDEDSRKIFANEYWDDRNVLVQCSKNSYIEHRIERTDHEDALVSRMKNFNKN